MPVSLDQVASSGTCAGANYCALLSTDQRASNQACQTSDKCSFGSAVVRTSVVAARSLRVCIGSLEDAY